MPASSVPFMVHRGLCLGIAHCTIWDGQRGQQTGSLAGSQLGSHKGYDEGRQVGHAGMQNSCNSVLLDSDQC